MNRIMREDEAGDGRASKQQQNVCFFSGGGGVGHRLTTTTTAVANYVFDLEKSCNKNKRKQKENRQQLDDCTWVLSGY